MPRIGGLKKEFENILRRTLSLIMPQDVVEKMGAKHVKGVLLHGASGCGKKLMAREIGKMLSAHEPQIVNGEEILKYDACFRKHFKAAEEEQKKSGVNSAPHIIIIDKIEAFFRQPESVAGASVVGQLCSEFDQINNILVFGITNRLDLISERLMRPGRLEVKIEIGIPDEQARLEILGIHCAKMIESGMISKDVDLKEISALTKNFTGAELVGLVNRATSFALLRIAQGGSSAEVDMATIENNKVCKRDFIAALENDIKPAYGFKKEDLEKKVQKNGILLTISRAQQPKSL